MSAFMNDVAIITCSKLPEPDTDEPLLLRALSERGMRAVMFPWDGDGTDAARATPALPDARISVVRSTWNYHHALPAFLAWVDAAAAHAPLWNGAKVIRWNTDKIYLKDLSDAGLAVTPTAYVDRGSKEELSAIMKARGWTDVVVKPRVSGGSFATTRHAVADLRGGELARIAEARALMVQPYMSTVDGRGERSYVFIDGELTHAIRKSPRLAGQEESVTPVPLDDTDVAFAKRVISFAEQKFGERPLYGRVDVARDDSGAPVVMELELVEPSLFFVHSDAALSRLVSGIADRLSRG